MIAVTAVIVVTRPARDVHLGARAHRARSSRDRCDHLESDVLRAAANSLPIASCLQGTILAQTAARLPTASSVAHGH
jgi:hypothetical protein